MGKLTNKTALITGGARGIGRAYAHRLAELGANVGIIDLDLQSFKQFDAEAKAMTANSIIEELQCKGTHSAGAEADVTDFDQVSEAVSKIASELGDIDILVANAGGGAGGLGDSIASSMNLEMFKQVVERNLYGTVNSVTAVVPMMKKNRYGKIVTVSSQAGIQATPDGSYAHYGSAKAGIIMYTKYLAQDLGQFGINVNCIAPGYIGTGRLMGDFERMGIANIIKNIALKRIGTPEDCANAIEFLTTNLSDYVTGTVLDVGGGCIRGGNI
ncbi:SDR family NAD(P)-dependent oxidoreductase [Neobacillus sp. YX16]|uniref:SDR family NAD(P)-dependent oxidoreductase n=1 Tax=Neobacillus sp. YX16 TaxID=3047874 RepID=UPI0024C26957|nr:SDR family NAD(P)-dependent oxidoreductase [Neobacillus sp. YX16]WHZ05245.1 SDR family NAD(P)-dependent oxidoreductase [Neobacillus sp. YX16]